MNVDTGAVRTLYPGEELNENEVPIHIEADEDCPVCGGGGISIQRRPDGEEKVICACAKVRVKVDEARGTEAFQKLTKLARSKNPPDWMKRFQRQVTNAELMKKQTYRRK